MDDRSILIAGATGGIGQAVSRSFAHAGWRVAMLGRDASKLEALRSELGGDDSRAIGRTCELTDRGEVNSCVESILHDWGSIEVLACCCGINVPQRSMRSLDPDDWDRILSVNLTGAFNVIHAVLPSMRDRGRGLIIQMGSLSGLRASTIAGAAYSASKFAQMALGACIGREERGRNIRSTVICAGEVNTTFLNQRAGRPGGAGGEAAGGRRELILQPEDIAAAVRFLVELPERAHVPELIIKPTIDDFS